MQTRRGLLFIALALVMGVAAAWIATRLASNPAAARGTPLETTPVVVVRTDVPVASSLRREQLDTVDWPAQHVPPGAVNSVDQAVDRIVRRPIAGGEPVLEAALFDPGSAGGLRAVISPEHRAVSVKVDNVIGVAGFVTPGARVDVLATIRRVDRERPLPYAKVILQDVRVLAVDQRLEEVKSGDPELVSVVTLEVDPMQAEHLIYAAHEGRLQLALRSPGDDEQVATRSIGVADVLGGKEPVKATKTSRAPRRPRTTVQVIKGSKLQVKTF
jgi:pilus assembly protein CpaB